MQTMILTTINFFLLVVTRKKLILTFLVCHLIFFQIFLMVELHKKAEINQRDLNKQIEELKYNYKPCNEKEKEEIDEVLVHANDMFEYRDKIIDAFKNGTFSSEHLKKSGDPAHDHVLEDVNNFVQKTESIAEKINLDLFEDFFESSSLPNCEKTLININNPDENIRICGRDRRQNIKFKRQNKKK